MPGALVLAGSLRDVHPNPPAAPEVPFQTVCLVTPETVDIKTVKALRRAFDVVVGVEVIEENQDEGLALLGEFRVLRGDGELWLHHVRNLP